MIHLLLSLADKDTTSSSVWLFSLLTRISLLSLSTSSSLENEEKKHILKFIEIIMQNNNTANCKLGSEDDYVSDESSKLSKVATSKAIVQEGLHECPSLRVS